jgi:predicted RNA-binding Zn ribbon-like protein
MSTRIPDLPILGEPLIPEFANTLYVDQSGTLDVFTRASWAAAWMVTAPCAIDASAPSRINKYDVTRLADLRNAIRAVLLSDLQSDRAAAVTTINQVAQQEAPCATLVLASDGKLAVTSKSGASGVDAFLSTIAWRFIELVDSGDIQLVNVCSRPQCNMFYFRDHHRRKYCNERCSSADRQARYNKRLR